IFTGIGHDRNLTIADLMARYLKTPTKVAATFIDYNFRFENAILELQQNLEATVQTKLVNAEKGLAQARQLLHWRVPALVANRKQGLLLSHTRLRHARHTLAHKNQQVSHLAQKLQGASQQCLKTWGQRVMLQSRLVEQLSPQATLQRGFAILQQQQAIITSTAAILPHQPITAVLADGEAEMNIVKINPHNHAHL
ncbi:MAG TPA: exodeoxyribonuclease VII large subunit, partial [Phnomibacter sp.]|nr:exodeoxyribonuclease VII large subunit [Phnomibacter sp.]